MSPEIYKNSKNLFLIFPPGCGGNHLANMLSLHQDFEPRYKTDGDYIAEIISSYKKQILRKRPPGYWVGDNAVHFSELENLQPSHLDQFKGNFLNSSKKYIFCSHAYEYLHSIHRISSLRELDNKIFLLFTRPTRKNMVAYLRWSTGPWSLGEPKFNSFNIRDNPENLYSIDALSSAINVDKDNILLINTDQFYAVDGIDYVNELLVEKFGITLTSHCKELHQIYINEKVYIYGSMMP